MNKLVLYSLAGIAAFLAKQSVVSAHITSISTRARVLLCMLLTAGVAPLAAQAAAGDLYDGGLNAPTGSLPDGALYKFNPAGTRTIFMSHTQIDWLAFDSKGSLFAGSPPNGVILKITPAGAATNFATGITPAGIAFDAVGNLFAINTAGTGSIVKYTPSGTPTSFVSNLGGGGPTGLAFDANGNLYVSFSGNNMIGGGSIVKFAPNGTMSPFASGLFLPAGLAVDSADNLYAADLGSGSIFRFTPTGTKANGELALQSNISGNNNTANGANALLSNTIGKGNTASGFQALSHNNGNLNTADGQNALISNTTGNNNTASGYAALASNTSGSFNIAIGNQAGVNLTTGSNNIDIGNAGGPAEAGVIRIGKSATATATFIAGISGKIAANGVGVIVNSNGQLGTVLSSARFKTDIKPMDKASEAILALTPVTFHYKQELDPDGISQFGLIAEEVEKVNPDLVVRGEDGKVNTVRYEAVNAMLLNEFLKEHRRVEQQDARLAKQETTIAQQKKDFASQLVRQQKAFEAKFAQQQQQVEALTATVQKVSNQLELNKADQQVVANNQ